jgi:hypothetical protein
MVASDLRKSWGEIVVRGSKRASHVGNSRKCSEIVAAEVFGKKTVNYRNF